MKEFEKPVMNCGCGGGHQLSNVVADEEMKRSSAVIVQRTLHIHPCIHSLSAICSQLQPRFASSISIPRLQIISTAWSWTTNVREAHSCWTECTRRGAVAQGLP